jgi:GT2 family glycosyltransferase
VSTDQQVDVVVVTWNTRDLTVEALRRLLDTDQGARLRLLVRDNASSDGTPQRVRERVPEAELEVGDRNVGFAAGVNTALRRSAAAWVLLLNSDAWPAEGAVGRLVEAALRHPRAAAVAPRLERPDGTLEPSTGPAPSMAVAALTATGAHHRIAPRWSHRRGVVGGWSWDEERQVDWAVGAAMLLRRAALADVGLFDEQFFMYGEDVEWCLRARRRGWEIWFTPDAVVTHVGNVSGARAYGERRSRAWIANTIRLYAREHGRVARGGYRLLNAMGATRAAVTARARSDRGRAQYWSEVARAWMQRLPKVDVPPGGDR